MTTKINPKMTVSGTFTIEQLEALIKAKHDYEHLASNYDFTIPRESLQSTQISELDAVKSDLKFKYQRFWVLLTSLNQKED
jgi:hypothetical protein